MSFKIKALKVFSKQFNKLDDRSKEVIREKINLISENPFRYKKINSPSFSKVFRIRLNLQDKETRLIYAVIEPNIILVCLLERKKDYKDLEKYLSKLKNE